MRALIVIAAAAAALVAAAWILNEQHRHALDDSDAGED